jgi:predicted adenine nucleotide alpha hydrolase (AANH) superfamily ATPase
MSILMHLCCGPCSLYPLEVLQNKGHKVCGYFFNPNIHPFREFKKRLGAVEEMAAHRNLKVDYLRDYGLRDFMRKVVFNEENRCAICYEIRLTAAVEHAKAVGADAFTSTLLYSRYQNHEKIRQIAEKLAVQHGIPFYYEDFRQGWQQGIDKSREMGLYRQTYCGCIYSEQERYDKRFRKRNNVLNTLNNS